MAANTNISLRNQVMYCVFVRNYSEEGTFRAVEADLDRIQALGTDIIWLMPIHPIGEKARKGSLGSPYAISDYRKVNPEFGTLEDFQSLVDAIHARGMKCIIDVVYNHTSPDSWLVRNHPEWFYRKADGSMGNHVGDWTDIVDLDYRNQDLWDYQIETLKQWARIVDGFRCDVAPLIPIEFWKAAREAVEAVRPGCIWLSESVEPHFIVNLRAMGLTCHSDCEVYQAFDLCYDYDIFGVFHDYLAGKRPLSAYADRVNLQEAIYPGNYVKLRYLENHDQDRAMARIGSESSLVNWTAFMYFQKGLPLIYCGQERGAAHCPSLFDKDTIAWNGDVDLSALMKKLYTIKKDPIFTNSTYQLTAHDDLDVLVGTHTAGGHALTGVFSMKGNSCQVPVGLPDGDYTELISGKTVTVTCGLLPCSGAPMILK